MHNDDCYAGTNASTHINVLAYVTRVCLELHNYCVCDVRMSVYAYEFMCVCV